MDEEEDSLNATITERRAKMTNVERVLEDLLCVKEGARRVEESLKCAQETAGRTEMTAVVLSTGEVAARSSLVAEQARFAAIDLERMLVNRGCRCWRCHRPPLAPAAAPRPSHTK